jgi:hypothetical protein
MYMYIFQVGQCCYTMLESLMALMETPAVSTSNSDDPQFSNSANEICNSTFYKLTSSICDSRSAKIGDGDDKKSYMDNIHMMVTFHPIDADNSVRHLLSFLGLICTPYQVLGKVCHIFIFYYLYVDSLTYAFGWSAFLCRIRFCDTVVVIIFK